MGPVWGLFVFLVLGIPAVKELGVNPEIRISQMEMAGEAIVCSLVRDCVCLRVYCRCHLGGQRAGGRGKRGVRKGVQAWPSPDQVREVRRKHQQPQDKEAPQPRKKRIWFVEGKVEEVG